MMTHAYSELYLNDAQRSLSSMFDYAVNDCKYDIDKAQGQILYKLAATLGCDIEDLLERPN